MNLGRRYLNRGDVPAAAIGPGLLAATSANNWGPGKIVAINDFQTTLEYFDSIGQVEPVRVTVPRASVRRFRAKPQTRCYWEAGGQWRIGRVVGMRDEAYAVRSSNARDGEVSESDLHVRWHRRLADPTDVLLVRGHESPYFHNCRQPFVTSLVAQRAACCGLTGLLSSVVQFYEHQVEVARRVLTDPVQRYLLADEVGLGKTIEAGLVIRQFLLDEPTAYVLVLAPEPLRVQWVKELREKFLVDDFSRATIKVMGHDDWKRWGKRGSPGMLVVDEAHHLADPTGGDVERDRFQQLEYLTTRASRVLLLTATPLLHNETSFLGMLHLLDPQLHDLGGIETFRSLLEKRQELGRLFFTFRPDTPGFLLEEKTTRLREMFPEDGPLFEMLDAVDGATALDGDASSLAESVVAVRAHINEAYRLHRRLLRTRRTDAVLDTYPVRGRKAPMGIIDEDSRRQAVNLWLDALRDQLLFETSRTQGSRLNFNEATALFWLFMEWSGTDLGQLELLGRLCLDPRGDSDVNDDLTPAERQLIDAFSFSDEVIDLLNHLIADLDFSPEGSRVSQAVSYLLTRTKGTKTVVFSRFPRVAARLNLQLTASAGASAVAAQLRNMDETKIDEELERFEHNTFCRFLVCDGSTEEGRNLQFADFMLHLDLHGNPNRLEQRIGRIDRYSSARAVESATFQDNPTIQPGFHSAWLECLVDGFRVFDSSISGMQYAIDRVMNEIRAKAFEGGAPLLRDCQDLVRLALEAEALAIAEQDALDGIETVDGDASVFSGLDDLENHWRSLQKASEDWICDAKGNLRFEKIDDSREREIVRFAINPDGRDPTLNNMPLVAWDVLADSFGPVVRKRGTFHREVALKTSDTRVFRIGEPFIDALAAFTQWDDRGRAFATWRCRGDWKGNPDLVAVRFDYIVEGDSVELLEAIRLHGSGLERGVAQRRVDSCFPPLVATIWLDIGLNEIENVTILGLVSEAYNPDLGDVHLSLARQWALDEVVGRDQWVPLIKGARVESQRLLEARPDFTAAMQAAQVRARRRAQVTVEQLRVRIHAAESTGTPVLADPADLKLETDLAAGVVFGVSHPIVSLDSVGLVILSGRVPVGPGFGPEDDSDDR